MTGPRWNAVECAAQGHSPADHEDPRDVASYEITVMTTHTGACDFAEDDETYCHEHGYDNPVCDEDEDAS
jgi:hypothetical protein